MAGPRPICLTSGLRRSLLALENQGGEIHTWVDDVGKKGASLCVEAQTCLAHTQPARPGPLTRVPLSCRVCGIVTTWALVAFLLGRPSP